MPYEHDAPVVHDEPVRRPPSRLTRWWWAIPRTGAGFALTLVLAAVAWFTGLARGWRGPFVALACLVVAEGSLWLVRRRRS